jgi:iduronate 2-sulfatase
MRYPRWLLPSLSLFFVVTAMAADRMNVLFVSVDDLRPELGAYGVTRALTPNVDAFAARAVKFDRPIASIRCATRRARPS